MPPAPSGPSTSYGPSRVPAARVTAPAPCSAQREEGSRALPLLDRGSRRSGPLEEAKDHGGRPDLDRVPIREPRGLLDPAAADEGSVLAAEVFQPRSRVIDRDPRMPARDGRVVDPDD